MKKFLSLSLLLSLGLATITPALNAQTMRQRFAGAMPRMPATPELKQRPPQSRSDQLKNFFDKLFYLAGQYDSHLNKIKQELIKQGINIEQEGTTPEMQEKEDRILREMRPEGNRILRNAYDILKKLTPEERSRSAANERVHLLILEAQTLDFKFLR